jgi:hypothetical protein
MNRCACLLALALWFPGQALVSAQDKAAPETKPADGVYAVVRDSLKKKDVLPLGKGEVLVDHNHRYVKSKDSEPPRFLVVRSTPDVILDLAGEPKAIKDGAEVVGIELKLRPKAAQALERLTSDRLGKQVAIVLGGKVVTMHKVRSVIKGGEVKITSCVPRAVAYLLEQLKARKATK